MQYTAEATLHPHHSRPNLMSSIGNLLSFPAPRVKKLLNWKPTGPDASDKWAETAVAVLVKRIEKHRGKEAGLEAMAQLERALAQPDVPSPCVTITRSMDGRIQVGHRKGLPHVIYCRVWRWPDLQSHHELQPMPHCEYHFDAKLADVCVNPTHYRRVDTSLMQPVLVQRMQAQQQQHQQQQMDAMAVVMMDCDVQQQRSSGTSTPEHSIDSGVYSHPNSPNNGGQLVPSAQLQYVMTTPQMPATLSYAMDCQPQDVNSVKPASQATDTTSTATVVPYEEPVQWATIAYFELNVRVGEIYQCVSHDVTVDGFTNPLNKTNRFCLGQLSNVHRNSTIEQTRRHIGRGIQLTFAEGKVYLRNVSDAAVFVQSRNMNYARNANLSAVCKVPAGHTLAIFDNVSFSQMLGQAVGHGFEVVYDLTKMCTIRMSFVKGWGAEYVRQDVTSTPCWIEVHMNGALKWLDKVLTTMGAPTHAISSVS